METGVKGVSRGCQGGVKGTVLCLLRRGDIEPSPVFLYFPLANISIASIIYIKKISYY